MQSEAFALLGCYAARVANLLVTFRDGMSVQFSEGQAVQEKFWSADWQLEVKYRKWRLFLFLVYFRVL
jgi:hypothetical protein